VLPDHDPETGDFERAAELAQAIGSEELLAAPAAELLPRRFAAYDIRLFEPRPVLHDCRCTPDRLAGIVRMLGTTEVEELLADVGCVELTCEFSNRTCRYAEQDAAAILRGESRSALLHYPPPPTTADRYASTRTAAPQREPLRLNANRCASTRTAAPQRNRCA